MKPVPEHRGRYPHLVTVPTRWKDNDLYGHVNNAAYYSYFDTAVNAYLIRAGVLDLQSGEVIGLVVETGCQYFSPVAFPDVLEVGIRVAHIGRTSVRYELAVFRQGEPHAAAQGHFVHVYVARDTRRPAPLPGALKDALSALIPEK
ncbi:MAG TPA: thioesterase family protein [Myxococcaceae bacterium]|nr:thioesterase family protein [Myxococcaceae bacterium]